MSGKERRIAPRRDCIIPLRFRVVTSGNDGSGQHPVAHDVMAEKSATYFGTTDGEAVNLSERGIAFKSRERLGIGDPIEVFLTLPRELTGRNPEKVRCSARVVHVNLEEDTLGLTGIGAVVERFETLSVIRDWGN